MGVITQMIDQPCKLQGSKFLLNHLKLINADAFGGTPKAAVGTTAIPEHVSPLCGDKLQRRARSARPTLPERF